MAEKIVKICDRCKEESVLYNTASWETCTFLKLSLGQSDPVKYDLCGKCANATKVFIIEAAANTKEGEEMADIYVCRQRGLSEPCDLCATNRTDTQLQGKTLKMPERIWLLKSVASLLGAEHFIVPPDAREHAYEYVRADLAQIDQLRQRIADLTAANISGLLREIKERLTPEEGEQFQALLMSATRGWVDEVTAQRPTERAK